MKFSKIRYMLSAVLPALLIFISVTSKAASPTDSVCGATGNNVRDLIVKMADQYRSWSQIETTGKLKMQKLPVAVTVKLWMKRSESVKMSLRVPFLGEVGRVELSDDSLLLVNKRSKCYCKESAESIRSMAPTAIDEIQNFLTGRMVLFGEGKFRQDISGNFDIMPDGGNWTVVPKDKFMPEHFSYGYIVGSDGLPKALMMSTHLADGGLTLLFDHASGLTIDFELTNKGKTESGSLELDPYKMTNEEFPSLNLSGKYRRVSIREFMRSF